MDALFVLGIVSIVAIVAVVAIVAICTSMGSRMHGITVATDYDLSDEFTSTKNRLSLSEKKAVVVGGVDAFKINDFLQKQGIRKSSVKFVAFGSAHDYERRKRILRLRPEPLFQATYIQISCRGVPNSIVLVTSAEYLGIQSHWSTHQMMYTGRISCKGYTVTNSVGGEARCDADSIYGCVAIPVKYASIFFDCGRKGKLDIVTLVRKSIRDGEVKLFLGEGDFSLALSLS